MIVKILQICLLAALCAVSVFVGVADLRVADIFSLEEGQLEILLISRVPRLLSAVIAGASLAVSGLIMQRITRNRFVSPTTAGTMEWCRLGVMAAILLAPGAGALLRVGLAFAVSFLGTALFMAIISKVQGRGAILVPLVGIMLGGVVNAASTFFAYRFDIIQNMSSWLQGNFSLVIAGNYELLYISAPLMLAAYFYADYFTIAGMGKNTAAALGLDREKVVLAGLLIVSVISSITVVEVGNIPFVGLIVPNIVSICKGDSVKDILWDTAWLGGALVLGCDIFGRLVIYPYEVPIGIILSVFGGATFLALIAGRKTCA